MIVTLPWPDPRLSPNARGHWAGLHRAKKKARWDAAFLALEAMNGQTQTFRASFAGNDPIPLKITFYPPDARARDDDNMVSSFKSCRDGLADALGVNDRRFAPEYEFASPVKHGCVEVVIG